MFFRCIHWLKRRLGYRPQARRTAPRLRPGYRPALEGLEDRRVPAFNLAISTAATAGVLHDPNTGAFTAVASGANINVADIRADLLAGKSVTISDGSTGNEAGHITWEFGTVLDYDGIGPADLTLTIATDPTSVNAALTFLGSIFDSNPATPEALNVNFSASGDVVIHQSIVAGAGAITLAADTRADGTGDDGVGDLNVNSGVTVRGGSVTLRGADVHIDTSSMPATITASRTKVTVGPSLQFPVGLAFGPDGNFYVSNALLGTVDRVTPQGKVTPFVSGLQGPVGLAFDSHGNLFVANDTNGTVSKVSPDGKTVTPFANGFNVPTGLAIDAQDNVYVADTQNNQVVKITPDGQTVTTFGPPFTTPTALAFDRRTGNLYVAGFDGNVFQVPPSNLYAIPYATGLSNPSGLAVDAQGNVYVSEPNGFAGAGGSRIARITAAMQVTTFVGGFTSPTGLTFDGQGNLYVADDRTNFLSRISPAGNVSLLAAGLGFPVGLVRDPAGNFFTTDAVSGTVEETTPAGLTSVFASGFNNPSGLARDAAGNWYVADNANNRVVKLSPDGKTATPFGPTFNLPTGLAFDRAGNLYVGNGDGTVDRVSPDGQTVTQFASGFSASDALAFDAQGDLFVADGFANSVTRLTPDGRGRTVLAGPFNSPAGLAFDPQGDLFVSSSTGATVIEVTPDGQSATFASGFLAPASIFVDGRGNVFVADSFASVIAWVSPGTVTVRSSLPGRPLSVGGADNAVAGVNLTDAELARLSAVNFVFGDSGQAGDITFVTAALSATSVRVLQDPAGPGAIVLDMSVSSSAALATGNGSLFLSAGRGGIQAVNAPFSALTLNTGTGTLYLNSGGPAGSAAQPLDVRTPLLGPGDIVGGLYLTDFVTLTTVGPLTAASITLTPSGGFISHAGDLQAGEIDLFFFNDIQTLDSGGQSFTNLTHHSAGTLQLVNHGLTLTGDLTNAGGDFDANNFAVSVGGHTTFSAGTYHAGSAPQVFTGGLVLDSTFLGGSGAVTAGGLTLKVGSSFTAPSTTLTITGDWTNNGGTFDANGGTVILAGTHQTISGSTTFFNLSEIAAGPDVLTFEAGSTQTILGLLTLRGAAGTLLALRSSTLGVSWNLDPKGGRSVFAVDVQDSTNLDPTPLIPNGALDSGDNRNWLFASVSGFSVSATAGVALAFNPADFAAHYADPAGNALTLVRIDTLPAHGTLTLAGVPVSAGQQVAGALLGELAYTAAPGFAGQDSFTWSGSQGVAFTAASATVTLAVTAAPTVPPTTNTPTATHTPATLTVVPRITVGAYDPLRGNWYLRDANSAGGPTAGQFQFGGFGPSGFADGLVGNWTGSGQFTPAVFYPASGTWYLRGSDGPTNSLVVPPFQFGGPTCIPLAGDWFHTGHFDVGVYDVSTSTFFLRNGLAGGAVTVIQFGDPAFGPFYPIAGDFTGSGTWTVGLVQLNTLTWFLKSANTQAAGATFFQWGSAGAMPLVGGWSGQGHSGIGLVVPVTNQPASPFDNDNLYLLRNEVSPGFADAGFFAFGGAGWTPVAGQWTLPTNPLSFQLADGEGPGAAAITQAQLDAAVAAALARLQQAGVSAGELARLASASYQLAALPAGQLGYTTASQDLVQLSADAAGHGWFVDPTPGQDEEFSGGLAWAASPAAGKEDLLTVVLHEMAHLVGVNDGGSGLMAEVLPEGTRRTDALDAVFAAIGR